MTHRLVDLCFGRGAAALVTPIQARCKPRISACEVEEVDPWKKEKRIRALWAPILAERGAPARPMSTLKAPKNGSYKAPGATDPTLPACTGTQLAPSVACPRLPTDTQESKNGIAGAVFSPRSAAGGRPLPLR